jgi:hypothetical protein
MVTSPQVHQIASTIIGSRYLVTSAVVWATLPCETNADEIASAQVFHMDYDYLDDIKLFINLSNVDAFSGALEYVAGSHRPGCKKIWSTEPIAEGRVWSHHPRRNRVLFTGLKGSAYISDNRGLHRDSPPSSGFWKLAMQVNFSRNQFGSEQVYAPTRPVLSPEWPSFGIWKDAMHAYPFLYNLLFSSNSSSL